MKYNNLTFNAVDEISFTVGTTENWHTYKSESDTNLYIWKQFLASNEYKLFVMVEQTRKNKFSVFEYPVVKNLVIGQNIIEEDIDWSN